MIYVSLGIFDREAANSDPQAGTPGGVGIIKSTDGGQTWNPAVEGLKNLYVGTLFMHPENPDILLAGTGNNQYHQFNGIYISTDGAGSWQQVLEGENITSVEFALSNPDIAYAGSANVVLRSTDGGVTWKAVSGSGEEVGWGPPGVRAGFPIDFQVDPRNPDRIFANNYGGGNFLSEDGGQTWSIASRGYTGAQVRDITVDPEQPGRVIAASRSGIFASHDGGVTWQGLSYPPVATLEWTVAAIDPVNPSRVIAGTNWNGVLVSSADGGASWVHAAEPFYNRVGWGAVMFAPTDPQVVYVSTAGFYSAGAFSPDEPGSGIYVSRDSGKSFQPANNDLSADAAALGLAVDPTNSQVVYAATFNHGLLRTTDGGANWAALDTGAPDGAMALSVKTHPFEGQIVLVGYERAGLYRSTDGGQTWGHTAAGLNPEEVSPISSLRLTTRM